MDSLRKLAVVVGLILSSTGFAESMQNSAFGELLERLDNDISRSSWDDELTEGLFKYAYLSGSSLDAISAVKTEASLKSFAVRNYVPDILADMGMYGYANKAIVNEDDPGVGGGQGAVEACRQFSTSW